MIKVQDFAQRKRIITVLILLVILLPILIWCNNNYYAYKSTIAKVINVEESFVKTEEGPEGQEEQYYNQNIIAIIKNGEHKGEEVSLNNTYSSSMMENEKYKKGDDLIINLKTEQKTGTILMVKRDKYVVMLIFLFIFTIVLISGKIGIQTIASLIVNIIAFIYFIKLYLEGKDFTSISIMMIIFFSIVTLLILGGINKKNIGSMISTLLTITLIFILYFVLVSNTKELHYEFIEYVYTPNDIENIFLTGMLLGCLGAVMDVAITINSSVKELINTSDSLTLRQLIKSIREIGHDIMGTMINVLMFSYVGGTLAIIVLKVVNGYSLAKLVKFDISLEIIRFLIGAIGIVAAVPISTIVAVMLFGKGIKKEV